MPYVLGNAEGMAAGGIGTSVEYLATGYRLAERLSTLHLARKVQFLLDATLGFISIEQNNVVKTLTVASVAGIPPVLIAGIYGMNFKLMPELDWALGLSPLRSSLIALSTIVPLAWFKLARLDVMEAAMDA